MHTASLVLCSITAGTRGRELKGKDDGMLRLEVFSTVTSDNDKSNVSTEEKLVSDNEVCTEERNEDIFSLSLVLAS